MGHTSEHVVIHQEPHRNTSVSSWATRTSSGYQTASDCSSEYSSSVHTERYRDPNAEGNCVQVINRKGHNGDVVVVNHHRGTKGPKEPTPNYSHAASYHSSSRR
ncbi:hypothetical protein NKR23_g3821 [Pleurostoma richardsiae]|uniref:Uncharacterized protein n=1 Tax=Pleurostoma richardsiae TaxID=41990 RepID=A0AA38VGM5_9PEZI|nr:hypothetical protein NKR23_g3821 [Pleurostoma richardsiae]